VPPCLGKLGASLLHRCLHRARINLGNHMALDHLRSHGYEQPVHNARELRAHANFGAGLEPDYPGCIHLNLQHACLRGDPVPIVGGQRSRPAHTPHDHGRQRTEDQDSAITPALDRRAL
jgi:hypothetical protein